MTKNQSENDSENYKDWYCFYGDGETHDKKIDELPASPPWQKFLDIEKDSELDKEIEQSQEIQQTDIKPTESSIFQVFAGEYTCSVKWGGETGIWRKESQPEHLWISSQGEVQFRSRFGLAVIQDLTVNEQRLSWDFGDNQTAASITFKVNSKDSYFWGDNQTGKLFQGWLNYPKEGKIDFRGRLVISDPLQSFPPIQG
ncbi:hypothetical protein [Nodularia sp. UHCC 0506]|uniref:hypothetical protein n=1 Tax=Nodularia sp. UHCC 0506 TaxID=3110243 RepID=UPI002B209CD3|nr:hypothetical protein [Nodularia sp. UHCC 0506]MEA5513613.1 hypothetical protein [Nodularia sp. UHCC 0506]